jgi:hypothetical protein
MKGSKGAGLELDDCFPSTGPDVSWRMASASILLGSRSPCQRHVRTATLGPGVGTKVFLSLLLT